MLTKWEEKRSAFHPKTFKTKLVMDPKLKHIVEVSDLLTKAEIQNYTSGIGLSQAECYRIELKITNNPANQDLLDAIDLSLSEQLFDDPSNTSIPLITKLAETTGNRIINSMSNSGVTQQETGNVEGGY